MHSSPPDLAQVHLIIGAAETEDDLGTVLRLHLAMEQLLNIYLDQKIVEDLKPYVRTPQEFARKLSLSAAFGLPISLVAALHQINRIRNELAHGKSSCLGKADVAELIRKVNYLADIDPTQKPLDRMYIELTQKNPGERVGLGQKGERFDFLLASMSLYIFAVKWMLVSFPEIAQVTAASPGPPAG